MLYSSGKKFPTVRADTEEVICEVQEADAADVDMAVAAAVNAFKLGSPWREMDGTGRRDLLNKIADLLEREKDYFEELESLDNGKPLGREGQYGTMGDIYLTIQHFRYFAGWADKIQGSTIPVEGNILCYTRKEAVGVCGCIIPWNFPMLMLAWKLAPALACGCTLVLKTSEKTPLTALRFAKLVQEAGFPPGVINILSGYGPTAGAALAKHPQVDKVAFTGSTAVGHKIQQYAAESNLKKVSLELGGKSAMIILDDADLDTAVSMTHVGLFLNQGQCCCAGSRIFVQEGIYDKFVQAIVAKAKSIKVGSFTESNVEQGPQVDEIQFKRVMGYLAKGKEEGATCMVGGERHGTKGYFVQPTIFTDVTDEMTIAKEEIFGPVMSVLRFTTDEEIVERANNTLYGLAAGIVATDAGRAIGMAHQIRAGTVWVNCYDNFDAAAPFGGYKESGHGRDKGEAALECWLETKCVMLPLKGYKA
jgi:aldehyde dehydrogenase (NAD+)